MKRLRDIAARPEFFVALGAILLGLFLWFVGPLVAIAGVAPLAPLWTRLLVLALIAAAYGAWLFLKRKRARRANAALVETLASVDADVAEEAGAVGGKLARAMEQLKATGVGGRAWLYQLPWYAIIGAPGSGKTTALLNSGLRFPLATDDADAVFHNLGGTRNCDFWFTDEAVLVDTAGRYTTQSSDRERDAGAWLKFLRMLKEKRQLQPLNGVIVAVPAPDLFAPEAERKAMAATLRARLSDIQRELGLTLPVYVVLTKLDLLQGFDAFFGQLNAAERDQVWGFTLPIEVSRRAEAAPAELMRGFGGLMERLGGRMLATVHDENDMERRGLAFAFPQQVRQLGEPLGELLQALGASTRFDSVPLIRGLYLTSATQHGQPIDRLIATLGAGLGLSAAASGRPGEGRAYFLGDLFRDVLFPEAGLAGNDPKAERRRTIRYAAGAGAAVAAAAALTIWFAAAYLRESATLDALAAGAEKYRQAVPALARADARTLDPAIIGAFEIVRTLPYVEGPTSSGLFSQASRVGEPLKAQLRTELNQWLLPALLLRAEGRVREAAQDPARLYGALKTYLILGRQGPPDDKGAVAGWVRTDLDRDAGVLQPEQRDAVAAQAATLMAGPIEPPAADARLIEASRVALLQQTPAQRVLAQIEASGAAQEQAPWRAADWFGPMEPEKVARLFDPAAQATAVPGLYTRAGYWNVFLPALAGSDALVAEQRWVMGRDRAAADTVFDERRVRSETAQLYASNYVRRWDEAMTRLQIAPVRSAAEAQRQMQVAADPASPLASVIEGMTRAAVVGPSPAPMTAKGKVPGLGKLALAAQQLAPSVDGARAAIDGHFRPLAAFATAPAGQPSQLRRALDTMASTAGALGQAQGAATVAGGGPGGTPGSGANAVADARGAVSNLEQSASAWPAPLDGWGRALAGNSGLSVNAARRTQLGSAWKAANEDDLCTRAIAAHFPLRRAGADIDLAAFRDYFGPNGRLAAFFDANVRSYVATDGAVWRATPEGAAAGVSGAQVRRFQTAQRVRDTYFAGAAEPRVQFSIAGTGPNEPGVARILFSIGDRSVTLTAGAPPPPNGFLWPDPYGVGDVRLELFDARNASLGSRTWPGSWGLMRLLVDARRTRLSPTMTRVTVPAPTIPVTLVLRAANAVNPLAEDPLARFECPNG